MRSSPYGIGMLCKDIQWWAVNFFWSFLRLRLSKYQTLTNIILDARLTSHHPAHRPRQSFKLEARDHFSHSRFQASCVSTSAERGEVEAVRAAPTVSWMEKLNVFSRVVPMLPTKLIIMHNQKLRTERRGSPALSWMLVDFSILYCRH